MDEHVYAVPDLTTDIKYGPRDRGEREERIVDIYVSADDLGLDPGPGTQQKAAQAQHGASDESRKNNAFKAATVCLGLLCVILLAVITGLGVHNTAELDELKRRLSLCESLGWQVFDRHGYYISTESKTWEESHKWCKDRQSQLIIINSKEEQDFVNSVVKAGQSVWLGLTDRDEEGVWTWVDGTPLTSPTYWHYGEPSNNGKEEREDCAELSKWYILTGWNNVACTTPLRWICEKDV